MTQSNTHIKTWKETWAAQVPQRIQGEFSCKYLQLIWNTEVCTFFLRSVLFLVGSHTGSFLWAEADSCLCPAGLLRMARMSVFRFSAVALLLLSACCWADDEVGPRERGAAMAAQGGVWLLVNTCWLMLKKNARWASSVTIKTQTVSYIRMKPVVFSTFTKTLSGGWIVNLFMPVLSYQAPLFTVLSITSSLSDDDALYPQSFILYNDGLLSHNL